jgi:hypothetical protein
MKAELLFFVVLLLAYPVLSYSVGVSPNKISFDNKEEEIVIFNPNAFQVEYSLKGCEYEFIEVLRSGIILNNTYRKISLRYNPSINANITNCTFDLFFANDVYSTGISIPVHFAMGNNNSKALSKERQSLPSFFALSDTQKTTDKKDSKIFIIILSVISFILIFVLILKYF